MPPRKRRRAFIAPPSPDHQTTVTAPRRPPEEAEVEPPPALPTIPADLLPEIAARSDFTTLVRCAACCRALRRDILRPAFIRRVCREPEPGGAAAAVPPCVLGFLHAYDKARMGELADPDRDRDRPAPPCFSAAHPATPGVASFFEKHLAPFAARTAGRSLLGDYEPLAASRNGLVVLRRRYLGGDRSSDICVYDPMSGGRTFLPSPPGIRIRKRKASEYGVSYTYVLLTAADLTIGGSSFLVLAADFTGLSSYSANITVQTASSDNADGTCPWGPVTMAAAPRSRWCSLQPQCGAVVLRGLIHWLMYDEEPFFFEQHFHIHILTYDVRTAMAGSIELPKHGLPHGCKLSNLHLASSPDGRLSLHVANKLKISVWLLGPAGAGAGDDGWSRHAVIDIAMTARSLTPPDMPYFWWLKEAVEFASSGARSGAILLRPFTGRWPTDNVEVEEEGEGALAVLDMETEELRRRVIKKKKHITLFPYEIDLEARLSAMKTF